MIRNMATAGRLSGLLIQALRNLGPVHVTPARIRRLHKRLPAKEHHGVVKDIALAPAWMRLLSPENRRLLATIEDRKPVSVADLAKLVGRAEPNVSRTLSKLAGAGFVRMKSGAGKAKTPEVAIHRLTVDIDVCRQADRVGVA